MRHPEPRPPAPCQEHFDIAELGVHWHHPDWLLLAALGDRISRLMLERWWPLSRQHRRRWAA